MSPKSGSSGAWGTTFASKAVAAIGSMWEEIWERRVVGEVWEEVEEEEVEGSGLRTGESGMMLTA